MLLVYVVSADVVRDKNDSTRCNPIRGPAQYNYNLQDVHIEEASDDVGKQIRDSIVLQQEKCQIIPAIALLTTQVSDKGLECSSFRLTDLFCRGAMWKSHLFDVSHGLRTMSRVRACSVTLVAVVIVALTRTFE